jgi:putative DNA primase/helicase
MNSPNLNLHQAAKALGGEVSGERVLCPGPGHSPKDRSLSVMLSATAPDGFIVHSFADDDDMACRDYVRAAVGILPFKPKTNERKTQKFDYKEPITGEARYAKIRHDNADGKKIYFKPAERGGSRALLYGGERLANAKAGEPVWIVEGENKVDRIVELGSIAVSADAGAKSRWLTDHAKLLRGRRIILWPDSDDPGEAYIINAAAAIRADNPDADIRVVRPFPRASQGEKGRDVCDWRGDAAALAKLAAGSKKYDEKMHVADPRQGAERQTVVDLMNGAAIAPLSISWFWEGWLARGKMHLIGGQPGTGKTTIAMSIAATISLAASRPVSWPDGTKCEEGGNVIVWSGEDDPADTLVPRLLAAGADLKHIFFVGGVREGEKSRDFDPAKDIAQLRVAIDQAGGAALLIVDPIVSAISGDSHKNAETRRGLQPLVELARDINAALIGITHFSKGTSGREPVERITGSLAFGALARVIMVAAVRPAKSECEAPSRMFARAKSNIGPDGGGFVYDLRQVRVQDNIFGSRVEWGEALDGAARDLLADAEQEEDGGAGREAETFLREMLADGPKPAKEIRAAADAHGLVWKTVQRAKGKIPGIIVRKITGSRFGGWEWKIQEGHKKDGSPEHGILSPLSPLSPLNKRDKKDNTDKKDIKNCGGVNVLLGHDAFLHGPSDVAEVEL